ncbi:MAG: hypothetical protein H7835_14785 [Magnetococcus sp. XQGC-1]
MFKLPGLLSKNATQSELADFAELWAWQAGSFSMQTMWDALGRDNENHYRGGPGDEDEANENLAGEVMGVLSRREEASNGAYPFRIEGSGYLLRYIEELSEERAEIYFYLLLCTRFDMQKERVLAGKDGTALFEKLTAHVLKNYLGAGRARSVVFGTAIPGAFAGKVDWLCQELGEGGGFRSLDPKDPPLSGGDGKLDAVAWVPFSDLRPGKLVLFAQSKTGTHWRDTTTQLQPRDFMNKWMWKHFIPEPMRVFCVAESVDDNRWHNVQAESGILFDRCRMVDFAHSVPPEILEEIRVWTQAGARKLFDSL